MKSVKTNTQSNLFYKQTKKYKFGMVVYPRVVITYEN